MSTSYIMVNHTKKEYINLSTIGKNNRWNSYNLFFSQLLGYIIIDESSLYWRKRIACDGDHENMRGHWSGDDIQLVSEHTQEYDIAKGLCDAKVFNEQKGEYEWVQVNKEESDKWIDITIPLTKDWNRAVEDCFCDDDYKKDLKIDLSFLDKPRYVADTGPRLDEAIKEAFKDLK